MPSSVKAVLETRELTKVFVGRHEASALRRVSFTVESGDFVVILGPSGSGKSTLLNLLGGLDKPSAGEIFLLGQPLHRLPERDVTALRQSRIGFIFQYFNLLSTLTAGENVMLPLRLRKLKENEMKRMATEMLQMVGLAHRQKHFPAQLSGGEQQRVAVARALVHRPDVILGDEPTGNLDSTNGQMIMELLSKLNRELGQTFVVVSHDQSFSRVANKVVYMRDGQIERIEVKARGAN